MESGFNISGGIWTMWRISSECESVIERKPALCLESYFYLTAVGLAAI